MVNYEVEPPSEQFDWDEALTQIVTTAFTEAYQRVEREKGHDRKCGCPSCAKIAVRDINEWTDWLNIQGGPVPKYAIGVERGKTKIYGPAINIEDRIKNAYDMYGNYIGTRYEEDSGTESEN